MKKLEIDMTYLQETMLSLLEIPSPAGFTDEIVRFMSEELGRLGIPNELTRRGAIRADLKGRESSPDRALITHLDTLGAMTKSLKPNGRLEIVPIGTWSSRFGEGARVSVFTDRGIYRGTILPLKASGHTFGDEIDQLPVSWQHVEVRVDVDCENDRDLARFGFRVGDWIAVDPCPEITDTGFVNTRYLDDKGGVAVVLATAKALVESKVPLPVDCHLLFTISEEVGSGASHILHRDVAEMVTIDTAPSAPGQNTREWGVTIAMMDSAGPFDYHLSHKLIALCHNLGIPCRRDVFRYYRSDSASAVEAGNDIRTALACFGADGTHGYERTHLSSLQALAELLSAYIQSDPTFRRDRKELGSLEGFPDPPPTEPGTPPAEILPPAKHRMPN